MCGRADPEAHAGTKLNRDALRVPVAAGAVAFLLAALTGSLSSPLIALPGLWLFLLKPGVLSLPVASAAMAAPLILVDLLTGGIGRPEALGALVLAAGAIGGRLRDRRQTDRLAALEARLAAIEHEAGRTTTDGSPEARAWRRAEAIREALVVAAATAGAERAVLWDADAGLRRISARLASDGQVSGGWLPFAGTPLGWLAEEGQPLRFDARPPVTAQSATVLAMRLDEGPRPTLLTLEYGPSGQALEPDALGPIAAGLQTALDGVAEQMEQVAYHRRVTVLLQALQRIPESVDPTSFARDLIRDATRLTGADGGAVALWADDRGTILAVDGESGGPAAGTHFAPGESVLALAARAAAPFQRELTSTKAGPPLIAAPGERWRRRPAHLATVPLPVGGEPVGLLAVWSTEPLDPEGTGLLQSLAPFAGTQLSRSLEFGRVRDSAERDPLTGLPNRRAFDRVLDGERVRLERYEHPLTLIVVDIDHFKAVNDTFGHEAGDVVLRGVAQTLRDALRDVDTVARFGGEEFVVLLPETGLQAGLETAERLRHGVENAAFEWQDDAIPIRISAGVSACPGCVPDVGDLMRSADAALYEAKGEGRNRVVAAPVTTAALRRRWERRSP